MPQEDVLASVIIVGYNSRSDLPECLSSVCSQTLNNYEVIFVDNNSDDGSVQFVREEFPSVRVVANTQNRWYAGGNNDGFESARGEYLVVLNPDVAVEDDWLERLIIPLKNDSDLALTTSRIVHYHDPGTLNTCGNMAHFTGLGFCRALGEPADSQPTPKKLGAVSGCSFAMRRDLYEKYGGFDELFEHYLEDVDISWRMRIAGYDILYVPDSVVYHKYDFSLAPWKLFNMERNRYLILLKHLRVRTLLAILPGILLTELLIWGYTLLTGRQAVKSKARSWWWLLTHIPAIKEERNQIQQIRRRPDNEILNNTHLSLPLDQLGMPAPVSKFGNRILEQAYRPWYWLGTHL